MATIYTRTLYINFNANGGSGAPSNTSDSQSNARQDGMVSITISSTKPTRTNYTFIDWSRSDGGTVAAGGTVIHTWDGSESYTYTDATHASASFTITLTANWKYSPPKTIRLVNSAGTDLETYNIYVVNDAGTGLDRYRATIVNDDGTNLINYK